MTKYIICLGDGMADHPIKSLGNKTPLQFAKTPHMDFISSNGQLGMVDTVPQGFLPGSDVANMGILGYDPALYYTGRGPIEAASLGVECAADETIFRCNLVTIANHTMIDFTSGHIESPESHVLIAELNRVFQNDPVRFIAGVGYRHIMVVKGDFKGLKTAAPHDIIDQTIDPFIPKGPLDTLLAQIMKKAHHYLKTAPINQSRISANKRPVTDIWPWSQGNYPKLPSFQKTYGKTGGIVTAVDLLKGLGKLSGLETPTVEGATGFIDTNYTNKVLAALKILKTHDFCYLHIEAPDEAGHMGDPKLKVRAIEDFDNQVVRHMLAYQKAQPDTVILVLPDHPTPCDIKTHTHEPVPFCIYHPGIINPSKLPYNEFTAKTTQDHFETPWGLLSHFLSLKPPIDHVQF